MSKLHEVLAVEQDVKNAKLREVPLCNSYEA